MWTVVGVRRWRARAGDQDVPTKPIACDMTALSSAERHRYDLLRRMVLDGVEEAHGTATGFHLRLRRDVSAAEIAEWMSLEHRCCPFLTLQLALKEDGTIRIDIGGSAAIKAFLEDEFKAFAHA